MFRILPRPIRRAVSTAATLLVLAGCSAKTRPATALAQVQVQPARPAPPAPTPQAKTAFELSHPVMLGIDVLEAEGFAAIRGKNIALLTHPAGVNAHGVSTLEILRHAPGVHLVALFGAENGFRDEIASGINYPDHIDARTGLPIYSLYNGINKGKPSRSQLKGIDAVVIDLQDIGSRTYTFVGAMKMCMASCFENGVEVVVLDRPNPLGGLKVDGPPLDPQWTTTFVGACSGCRTSTASRSANSPAWRSRRPTCWG